MYWVDDKQWLHDSANMINLNDVIRIISFEEYEERKKNSYSCLAYTHQVTRSLARRICGRLATIIDMPDQMANNYYVVIKFDDDYGTTVNLPVWMINKLNIKTYNEEWAFTVGSKVTIHDEEWYEWNKDTRKDYLQCEYCVKFYGKERAKYYGKEATVVMNLNGLIKLDIDGMKFWWTPSMFKDVKPNMETKDKRYKPDNKKKIKRGDKVIVYGNIPAFVTKVINNKWYTEPKYEVVFETDKDKFLCREERMQFKRTEIIKP